MKTFLTKENRSGYILISDKVDFREKKRIEAKKDVA